MKLKTDKAEAFLFIIPDPGDFESGGNIYNARLMASLRLLGYEVDRVNITGIEKKRLAKASVILVDTLYMNDPKVQDLVRNYVCLLIVHHLESLYPPTHWTSHQYFLEKEKPVLQAYAGFLTTSHYTSDYLAINGFSKQRTICVIPGIDFRFSPGVPEQGKLKAIMVANIVQRKGILPFLQHLAAKAKQELIGKLSIRLIGHEHLEPAYAKRCLKLIEDDPILKQIFRYAGALPHDKTLGLMNDASLFISTAFMETYGMALQEARALNLPILALKGGHTENHITQGATGLLFEEMTDLVQALIQMASSDGKLQVLQTEIASRNQDAFYSWSEAAYSFIQQWLTFRQANLST